VAVDWIKMQGNLWTSPKVVRVMSATKADKCRVIGALFRVWCLFDEHTEDGILEGYTKFLLDDELRIDGFADALESIGWLIDLEDGLQVPDFNDHMSKSSKKRAQDTRRKRVVRNMSAPQADKNKTREEKRREESKSIVGQAATVIAQLNSLAGTKYQPVESNLNLVRARLKEGYTIKNLFDVIKSKCDEWLGTDSEKYLRPATLFSATKFSQYHGQVDKGFSKKSEVATMSNDQLMDMAGKLNIHTGGLSRPALISAIEAAQ